MNQPDCLERFGLSRGNGGRFPSCLVHFDKGGDKGTNRPYWLECFGRRRGDGANCPNRLTFLGSGEAMGRIARTVSCIRPGRDKGENFPDYLERFGPERGNRANCQFERRLKEGLVEGDSCV